MKDRLSAFYRKHTTIILYNLFGCATVGVNYGSYYLFNELLHSHVAGAYFYAHILSWVFSVIFSYIVNKRFVFKPDTKNLQPARFLSFVLIRVVTEGIALFSMFLFVTLLCFNSYAVKLLTDVFQVVINYFFTKYISFNSAEKSGTSR